MLAISFLLLVIALLLFWWGNRQKKESGLPQGKVVALDLHDNQRTQAPLFSPRYLLTGKPDYLLRRGREWIPVEVKTVSQFRQPYEGHIYQLFAYCLLIEEQYGLRPRYGYLHYRNRSQAERVNTTFQIEFTAEMRERLLALLSRMRQAEQRGDVPRSHQESARCRGCGYNAICDQKL